jgi:aminoacylase
MFFLPFLVCDVSISLSLSLTTIPSLPQSSIVTILTLLTTLQVPDEEIGGADGMSIMLSSEWYQSIDVGIALDEGLASEDDHFSVFYGERLPWWIKMEAKGNTGHASRFIDDTAVPSIISVVNKALDFRETQRQKLHNGSACDHACSHSVARKTTLGDVTSLNVTVLKAGVNV